MAEKRYFWIKLNENFFNLDTVDFLFSQKNGCEYIVLYLKLLLQTKNTDGDMATKIGEMTIPYDAEKIARDTKFSVDTVLVGLELFKKLGMIVEKDNGIYNIPYTEATIGSETSAAKRMREHRKNKSNDKRTLCEHCANNVTQENRYKRIDNRDKSIESKSIERLNTNISNKEDKPHTPKKAYGKYRNVLLSDDEYKLLIEQYGNPEKLIERLDRYKEKSGKKYNSDYIAITDWVVKAVKEDRENKKPEIDSTYDIEEINRRAMMNEDLDKIYNSI
ncbi:phage replisome organizer N-terminal domain-containing protein [uncultured Eubacterium sp.]|uniref:phage replisome organizer N-terminal domain-containing protein n=1 Tax=uncultured Eubacterium sp. TaxID=165185 RepID=UPI0025E6287D|nr:phage replisome organizer N-terminal domain-containing protein [uncultured Eubacterium sp.]